MKAHDTPSTHTSFALTKAQLRGLHALHTRFAEDAARLLAELLPGCTVAATSLRETGADALDASTYYRFEFATRAPRAGFLECSEALGMRLTERVLGAGGSGERRLSVIETQLLCRTLQPLLAAYGALWPSACTPKFIIADSADGGEPCFTVTYAVQGTDVNGEIVLTLYLSAWREALAQIGPPERPQRGNAHLLNVLGHCVVPTRVLFGRATLTVDELLSLCVGDVLCLDRPVDAPVEVHFNQHPKLLGRVQTQDDRYTVTITEVMAGGSRR